MKRIVAFAIGSYGDCSPFIELGSEMIKRGYNFTIVSFEDHRNHIVKRGIDFIPIHGNLEEMTRVLLSESKGAGDSMTGLKNILKEATGLYDDFYNAAITADLIIYMQFGALAYHFAQAFNIPCIRTLVYPFDVTAKYSSMFPESAKSAFKCKLSYYASFVMMNIISLEKANEFRKKLMLDKWNLFRFYIKMNGKRLPTIYQFSDVLAPKDPKWGSETYLTGPWFPKNKNEYDIDPALDQFLNNGSKPVFIGFGSMVYTRMDELQDKLIKALKACGLRAVFVSSVTSFKPSEDEDFFYTNFVPYDYLFDRVCGVVHHGGCGTTHLGLIHGCPTFILSFGGDQDFWGYRVHELGAGPKYMRVNHDEITIGELKDRLSEIKKGKYDEGAKKIGREISKDIGVLKAAEIVERIISVQDNRE